MKYRKTLELNLQAFEDHQAILHFTVHCCTYHCTYQCTYHCTYQCIVHMYISHNAAFTPDSNYSKAITPTE